MISRVRSLAVTISDSVLSATCEKRVIVHGCETATLLALFEGRAGCWIRSSYKGRMADALALEADEGRGYLRKDPGSW